MNSESPQSSSESKSTHGHRASHLTHRLVSNASIYGALNILLKLGAFIVLPLYWHKLTPADFGFIALSQIVTQFLASILDLGLSGAIQRHFFEWSPTERPKYLGVIFVFSIIFSSLVSLSFWFLTEPLVDLFGGEFNSQLLKFGLAIAFLQNLGTLPFSIYRSLEKLRSFTVLTLAQFITQTICILFFIYQWELGYQGFLWGSLIGSFIYALLSLGVIFREVEFNTRWKYLREPLRYALPTLPAGILESFGAIVDRIFLHNFVSMADLGIYSVGRQFGMAYNFIASSLKNSWIPLVYRMTSERKDAGKVLGQMSTYYFFILTIFAVYASMFSVDVMVVLKKQEYAAVSQYAPFFILFYFFQGIGHIFGRGIDLAKKTQYYWIVHTVNVASCLLLLKLWAPQYGVWGAIAAMTVSSFLRESVQIGIAFYVYPRPIEVIKILKTVLFFSVAYISTTLLHIESLLLLIFIKSVFAVLIGFGGFFFVFGKSGFGTAKDMILRRLLLDREKS